MIESHRNIAKRVKPRMKVGEGDPGTWSGWYMIQDLAPYHLGGPILDPSPSMREALPTCRIACLVRAFAVLFPCRFQKNSKVAAKLRGRKPVDG